MKQCPVCNRTYENDKQKFCTQDGGSLVHAQSAGSEQETVRIDSQQLDKEVTKVISRELPPMAGGFDPYKTVMSTPQPSTAATQPTPPATPPSPPPVEIPPATPPAVEPQTRSSQALPPSAGEASQVTMPPTTAAPVATPPPAEAPTQVTDAQATAAYLPTAGEAGVVTMPPPSAPLSSAANAVAAPSAVQPRKKRSKLPLVLGILFVLLLLGACGAVAGYFFVLKPMLAKKRIAVLEPRRQPTPIVEQTPDVRNTKTETPKLKVPPYSPPANAVPFVNSNAKLSGRLAEHYVDFSFYYPSGWQKDPQSGVAGATNFVQVERRLPPNYTLENFAVGWYSSAGSAEADRTTFPRLVASLSAKFEKTIDNYRKVSERETKVGPYDAHEFRFEGLSQQTDKGQFKIWGVAIFVPPVNGGNDGVTLLMLATSLAPELKSINDVGVKGELPMVLDSFRFGK